MSTMNDPYFSSFDFYETLFLNTKQNTILSLNTDGTIVEINRAFSNSFGYTREDIIGKNFSILFTEEDQDKDLPQKELSTVLHQGQAYDNNYLVNKNGQKTWVSGESILLKNKEGKLGILKIIQNIHEQKESESSILRLNSFNESILGSIEDAVIVLNNDLKIIKANQAFSRLFKRSEPDISSINFAELIKPYDLKDELLHHLQHTIQTKNGFLSRQLEINSADGYKKMFDISCAVMEHAGSQDNLLLVVHDITMQKQVEREREDIIGFVAHELRNPLANIVLCNEIMGEMIKVNNIDSINDFLQRSKNNVLRLNKMIAELYDATKVNAGNFKLEIAPFNFAGMIKEAIDTIEVLHPSFKIQVYGEADINVHGDRHRLIQVVTNYLSNGIKYSNNNTEVSITVTHDAHTVTVSVKDKGLGIPKNQLPYIFDRFFRAEKTKNLEGIGLGLYLCRQIIDAHKGNVWVESEDGNGSVFYFSIPV